MDILGLAIRNTLRTIPVLKQNEKGPRFSEAHTAGSENASSSYLVINWQQKILQISLSALNAKIGAKTFPELKFQFLDLVNAACSKLQKI